MPEQLSDEQFRERVEKVALRIGKSLTDEHDVGVIGAALSIVVQSVDAAVAVSNPGARKGAFVETMVGALGGRISKSGAGIA